MSTDVGPMSKIALGQCYIVMLNRQIDDVIPNLDQIMVAIWNDIEKRQTMAEKKLGWACNAYCS